MNYHKVEAYLRNYSSQESPYDANGAMYLLKAIIENLQEHFIENDFDQYAACLDQENEMFIKKLLSSIPISRMKDAE